MTPSNWIATARLTQIAMTKAQYPTDGGTNSRNRLLRPAHRHP